MLRASPDSFRIEDTMDDLARGHDDVLELVRLVRAAPGVVRDDWQIVDRRLPRRGDAVGAYLGCQTASYSLSGVHVVREANLANTGDYVVAMIVDATAVVTSKVTDDQTCWGQRAPSPLYVMTLYPAARCPVGADHPLGDASYPS
jgi:hypothetical protein